MIKLLFILCLTIFFNISAQTHEGLIDLPDYSIRTYYSPGNEENAKVTTERCEDAINYIYSLIGFKPVVSLFILNPEHWEAYANYPVYGMPHYLDNERLVVAAQDNEYWRSFLPPPDQLPTYLASKIEQAYKNEEGEISMKAFFDLLILHELGHAFHKQGSLTMQRLWMQELFCNIMLHTYIAENEPSELPALEVFPNMVVEAGSDEYRFTALADFEKQYIDMDPKNYGWYQCRLHSAARDIYNSGGKESFIRLWNGLKENQTRMTDDELTAFLKDNVHKEIAKVQTDW
jgi:hypothetical protein